MVVGEEKYVVDSAGCGGGEVVNLTGWGEREMVDCPDGGENK